MAKAKVVVVQTPLRCIQEIKGHQRKDICKQPIKYCNYGWPDKEDLPGILKPYLSSTYELTVSKWTYHEGIQDRYTLEHAPRTSRDPCLYTCDVCIYTSIYTAVITSFLWLRAILMTVPTSIAVYYSVMHIIETTSYDSNVSTKVLFSF